MKSVANAVWGYTTALPTVSDFKGRFTVVYLYDLIGPPLSLYLPRSRVWRQDLKEDWPVHCKGQCVYPSVFGGRERRLIVCL